MNYTIYKGGDIMSYAVVKAEKFQMSSIERIENQDLNNSSYHILKPEGSFRQVIKNRIQELDLPKVIRKDAVVMVQINVTSDRTFFDHLSSGQQKEFFIQSYEFLKERYGEKNVISATVHMDEKTPYMHFTFIPVTSENRLSAKTVLSRMSLICQHDDFYKKVGLSWNLKRVEKDGYKDDPEKEVCNRHISYEELEDLKREIEDLRIIKSNLQSDIEELNANRTKLGKYGGLVID